MDNCIRTLACLSTSLTTRKLVVCADSMHLFLVLYAHSCIQGSALSPAVAAGNFALLLGELARESHWRETIGKASGVIETLV